MKHHVALGCALALVPWSVAVLAQTPPPSPDPLRCSAQEPDRCLNGGGQDVDTTTLVPYFTMLVSDAFSVDFNAGYGRLKASQNRIDPACRKDGSEAGGLPSAVGSTQPADRNEMEWVLGLRFFAKRGAAIAAEYTKTTGRDRFEHRAYNFVARFDF